MVIMPHVAYDKHTKRHILEFINQQFDCLMIIAYDEKSASYKFDVDDAEAKRIYDACSSVPFNKEHWLHVAATQLPEADKKLQ
jgi:hypothetical protein